MHVHDVIDDSFVKQLAPETKTWLAKAIVGIITADGTVTTAELESLRDALGFLEDAKELDALIMAVKQKQIPELDALSRAEGKDKAQIMFYLGCVTAADDKLPRVAVDYYKTVGSRLGYDARLCNEVMQWFRQWLDLEKKRQALIKIGDTHRPIYRTSDR